MSDSEGPPPASPIPATGTRAAAASGADAAAEPQHRFTYEGDTADLWPMTLKIALLNLVTLFFYRFWGRTRVRQYLWGRTSLLGDRFVYTGTGKEMFLGFVIVFFVVLLPIFAASAYVVLYWSEDMGAQMAFFYGLGAVTYFLFFVASYRALRYRLSRTNWRGIRGNQTGSAVVYALKAFGWLLLVPLTMGLLYPVQSVSLTGTRLKNAWFGDRQFAFESEGRSGLLYGPYLRAWLGFIFKPFGIVILALLVIALALWALGIDLPGRFAETREGEPVKLDLGLGLFLVIWGLVALGWLRTYTRYKARELAIMADWVRFGRLRFRFDADHNQLFRLVFGNILITALTLGFGRPFAQNRMVRFIARHLTVVGVPDLDTLGQSTGRAPGMGEGLADAFDAGSI